MPSPPRPKTAGAVSGRAPGLVLREGGRMSGAPAGSDVLEPFLRGRFRHCGSVTVLAVPLRAETAVMHCFGPVRGPRSAQVSPAPIARPRENPLDPSLGSKNPASAFAASRDPPPRPNMPCSHAHGGGCLGHRLAGTRSFANRTNPDARRPAIVRCADRIKLEQIGNKLKWGGRGRWVGGQGMGQLNDEVSTVTLRHPGPDPGSIPQRVDTGWRQMWEGPPSPRPFDGLEWIPAQGRDDESSGTPRFGEPARGRIRSGSRMVRVSFAPHATPSAAPSPPSTA